MGYTNCHHHDYLMLLGEAVAGVVGFAGLWKIGLRFGWFFNFMYRPVV